MQALTPRVVFTVHDSQPAGQQTAPAHLANHYKVNGVHVRVPEVRGDTHCSWEVSGSRKEATRLRVNALAEDVDMIEVRPGIYKVTWCGQELLIPREYLPEPHELVPGGEVLVLHVYLAELRCVPADDLADQAAPMLPAVRPPLGEDVRVFV